MAITLKQLVSAAQLLLHTNAAAAVQEAALKLAKEKARILREETIPNAMLELGITRLDLDGGQTLTMTQEVYASIPADQTTAAFEWLNKNGHGGLIKTEVKTLYGKGERKLAEKLAIQLCNKGLNTTFNESVHPQTLKAFLKEQIREGKKCPLDLFGARPVMTTKIK